MLKCKHQCHCAYSLEIGTCIINDVGRQAAHKKKQNYKFLVESHQTMIYTHVLKVYINFQCEKKLYQTQQHYTFLFCTFSALHYLTTDFFKLTIKLESVVINYVNNLLRLDWPFNV